MNAYQAGKVRLSPSLQTLACLISAGYEYRGVNRRAFRSNPGFTVRGEFLRSMLGFRTEIMAKNEPPCPHAGILATLVVYGRRVPELPALPACLEIVLILPSLGITASWALSWCAKCLRRDVKKRAVCRRRRFKLPGAPFTSSLTPPLYLSVRWYHGAF